jgi:acetyltransferase-like isoleucine patch superfamily enzyme
MHNPFDTGYYATEELLSFGFASVGENVRIAKNCTIVQPQNISIGDHSRIDGFCSIIATGPLAIGNRVHIHSYCQIGARGGVTLEDYSALASGCLVYSASDDPLGRYMIGGTLPDHCTNPKVAPVRFMRHSGAFSRSTILPGVTFEEGAMACAHSLVSRTVPEWTIVSGSPAVHRLNRSRRLLALVPHDEELVAA